MSTFSESLLSQTIDDTITWMGMWSRLALTTTPDRGASTESLTAPESFALWRREAAKALQDQPTLERLGVLHDQMHRAARLVMLKTPEGHTVSPQDYDSVASKYQELVTGLRRVERALAAAESGLDILTGLRSRLGMQDDLTREFSRFQRSGKPFCLVLMDIDHFKKVNDTYGHESGDRVLSSVANHISRSLRPFDDAWRWGGEEFLLCLKETNLTGGCLALERVREGLEKTPIKLANGQVIRVTASFGLVAVHKDATIDTMLIDADKALYRAKEGGRNRIETVTA